MTEKTAPIIHAPKTGTVNYKAGAWQSECVCGWTSQRCDEASGAALELVEHIDNAPPKSRDFLAVLKDLRAKFRDNAGDK